MLHSVIELFYNIPFYGLNTSCQETQPIHSSELLSLLRLLEDATREIEAILHHNTKDKVFIISYNLLFFN